MRKKGIGSRLTCIVLSICLLTGLGMSALAEDSAPEIDYTTGTPWICSFLDSNVTADMPTPRLQDDFCLACNKEELQTMQNPEGTSEIGTQDAVEMQVKDDLKALFTSGVETDDHDAQLALNLYSLYADWDSRNAVGVAPLKALVDAVEAIDSMDALTDYLATTPPEDRLYQLFSVDYMVSLDDAAKYDVVVMSTNLLLNDAAEYAAPTALGRTRKRANSTLATRILGKLGYSGAEASAKLERCLAFEAELAASMMSKTDKRRPDYLSRVNNRYTREALARAQGSVPMLAVIEQAEGYPESESYIIFEPEWLAKLNDLYTPDHLEAIRDYLIVHGVLSAKYLLDHDCYEWSRTCINEINGSQGDMSEEIVQSDLVSSDLEWPVAKLYCEHYLNEDDKDRISGLIDEIIAEYHGIINEADFLTDQTKTAAIEKLEAIEKEVLWPDDWSLYACDGLEIASAADGGTLWEAERAIKAYFKKKDVEECQEPVNREKWGFNPCMFNCCYDSSLNVIMILGAFARGDIYNSEMSDEDLYARLGVVIGHEISHAFDSTGAQFDKDGNMKQWWTDEDWAVFQERNAKLVAYIDNIHPWEGQDNVAAIKSGELCADMGGMKCVLRLVAKKEGFDYDRFFRSFADMWMAKGTLNSTHIYIRDEHPMPYQRVNCTLQQFDEFIDLYGIREGDGMYLAPEDRVNIW